jgi:molybdopterin molybdotransferase
MRDMLGRGQAVSVSEALRRILESIPLTDVPGVKIPLAEASGRVLAGDIVSPEDLPGFSRSTVDGYAVLSGDTFGASETSPVYLSVINEIFMGQEPGFELKKGEAARIATGGMLPGGADAVMMFEHAQTLDERMVEVQKAVAPGDNVIQRGEDVRAGELILGGGRRLRPYDVAVIAGIGFSEANVFERPTVSIISTGDEVVSEGKPVKPGQVRDMNSLILAGLLVEDGALPLRKGIVGDSLDALKSAVEGSFKESGMVLITGGSSVGVKDMTESVISEVGKVLFHSVSMKPGKPMLAGISDGKPVLGLPGHPRAVAVCYEVFIRPLVERLSGLRPKTMDDMRRTIRARLAKSVRSTLGRQEVISVALEFRNGDLWAEPMLGKSGLLSMLVRADGTVTVSDGKPGIQKGQEVDVKLI